MHTNQLPKIYFGHTIRLLPTNRFIKMCVNLVSRKIAGSQKGEKGRKGGCYEKVYCFLQDQQTTSCPIPTGESCSSGGVSSPFCPPKSTTAAATTSGTSCNGGWVAGATATPIKHTFCHYTEAEARACPPGSAFSPPSPRGSAVTGVHTPGHGGLGLQPRHVRYASAKASAEHHQDSISRM